MKKTAVAVFCTMFSKLTKTLLEMRYTPNAGQRQERDIFILFRITNSVYLPLRLFECIQKLCEFLV